MLRCRVVYGAVLLVTLLSFIMYEPYLFHWLFYMTLLLPLLSLLLTLPLWGKLEAEVFFPRGEAGKGAVPVSFRVTNRSFLPCACIRFRMRYQNMLGKSKLQVFQYQTETVRFPAAPKDTATVRTTFRMPYCGRTDMELMQVRMLDLLGLFALPVKNCSLTANTVFVQPDLLPLTVVPGKAAPAADGEVSPRIVSGNDPAEIIGIRDYAPGDRLRDVHWKLSARTDHLLVKEHGKPLVPAADFLLELQDGVNTAAADRALSLFYTAASGLLRQGTVCRVSFMPSEESFDTRLLTAENDLIPCMDALLSLPGLAPWSILDRRVKARQPASGGHLVCIFAGIDRRLIDPKDARQRIEAVLTCCRYDLVTVFCEDCPDDLREELSKIGCRVLSLQEAAEQGVLLL